MNYQVSSQYEHSLQCVYFDISNRGIRIDVERLKHARSIANAEILRNLAIASNQWGCKVFIGAENAPTDDATGSGAVNINATQGKFAFLKKLKELGYNVPKIAKKNEEGDYESNYSAGELALQKILAANQFEYPGGDPAIRAILKVREYGKLKSGYLNAKLLNRNSCPFYLSLYNVAGTITGRRNSRKHTFRFGGNGQNFPKHSDIARLFLECLIAREEHIFLFVDQIQAEDWPVSALAYNLQSLAELRAGIDRHTKLASMIFNISVSSRSESEWKDSMERYLGKKIRHASNYDMTAPRMSDALAQEGHVVETSKCDFFLKKMAQIDPSIKGVFHKYIQDTISKTRLLITPFGRERQVLGARPGDYNNSIFKECYAFIPQSVVGDNTGFSVLNLESNPDSKGFIIQEGHDSITQDIPRNIDMIYKTLIRTVHSFDRRIRFHNGIEVQIPIEAEIGYDFKKRVKIKNFTREGIRIALEKLDDSTGRGKVVLSGAAVEGIVA